MEAKFAMRFTPPMMMTPRSTAITAAEIFTSIPHALSTAAATPLAWMPGRKYDVASNMHTAKMMA